MGRDPELEQDLEQLGNAYLALEANAGSLKRTRNIFTSLLITGGMVNMAVNENITNPTGIAAMVGGIAIWSGSTYFLQHDVRDASDQVIETMTEAFRATGDN